MRRGFYRVTGMMGMLLRSVTCVVLAPLSTGYRLGLWATAFLGQIIMVLLLRMVLIVVSMDLVVPLALCRIGTRFVLLMTRLILGMRKTVLPVRKWGGWLPP